MFIYEFIEITEFCEVFLEHPNPFRSQASGTPRSIEDLTSDERFGSFMPNTGSTRSTPNNLVKPVIIEEIELENTFEQSSLEEGEIRDTFDHELSQLNKSGREIIDKQIEEEIQTSKLKEELELEQIELRLQIERNNESQQTSGLNTQSTSGLKSEDAVAPVFPPEAYGSRDTSLNKRCSPTSIYPKKPREAWTEMTPQPTPDVSFRKPEIKK